MAGTSTGTLTSFTTSFISTTGVAVAGADDVAVAVTADSSVLFCFFLSILPDFSREELIKIIYIPKNKFAQLFKLYARTSFSKYVNNLRLEYAAGMLKEHPYYTIDAIAKECGMSTVQTFYRLFSEKFGVTPTEFRSGLKIPENECNND